MRERQQMQAQAQQGQRGKGQRKKRHGMSTVKGGDRGSCGFCRYGKPALAGAAIAAAVAAATGGNVTNWLLLGAAAGAGVGAVR